MQLKAQINWAKYVIAIALAIAAFIILLIIIKKILLGTLV
jgi:hypothetical protein